jgi:putative toxin-antitoxin system antitoxin component (TIGR02293 family)
MANMKEAFILDLLAIKPPRSGGAAAAAFGSVINSALLVEKVRRGLPVRAFAILREAINVPTERLARLVHIPVRTLARRQVFKVDESERIVRIGRLFQRASEVLGGEAEARRWLVQPQKALGNLIPLDYADTEPGAREVEDLLGRLEHGVFS